MKIRRYISTLVKKFPIYLNIYFFKLTKIDPSFSAPIKSEVKQELNEKPHKKSKFYTPPKISITENSKKNSTARKSAHRSLTEEAKKAEELHKQKVFSVMKVNLLNKLS